MRDYSPGNNLYPSIIICKKWAGLAISCDNVAEFGWAIS